MRVIAELPHPHFKITIFSMNAKFIIKFEQGTFEQTYKLSEIDVVGGINGLFEILDDDFYEAVSDRFISMRSDFTAAYKRHEF